MARYVQLEPLPGVSDLWSLLTLLLDESKRTLVMDWLSSAESIRAAVNKEIGDLIEANSLADARSKLNEDVAAFKAEVAERDRREQTSLAELAQAHRDLVIRETTLTSDRLTLDAAIEQHSADKMLAESDIAAHEERIKEMADRSFARDAEAEAKLREAKDLQDRLKLRIAQLAAAGVSVNLDG